MSFGRNEYAVHDMQFGLQALRYGSTVEGALLCGTACKFHHAGFEAHGVSTRCVHVCVSCMDRTTVLQYRNMTTVTGSLGVR